MRILFYKKRVSIVGECNHCGTCCRNLYLYYGRKQITSKKFFNTVKKIDPEFRHFHIKEVDDEGHISFYCDKIDESNMCTIYENRPSFCREYPSLYVLNIDKKVLNGCGYFAKRHSNFKDYYELKKMSDTKQGDMSPCLPSKKKVL